MPEPSEPSERTLRFLFWNVFLLRPRLLPGGPPLPAIGDLAAPAAAERAGEIGRTLSGHYDLVAFAEAFDERERRRLLAGWGGGTRLTAVTGPDRSLRPGHPAAFASSGLLTVADGVRVRRVERHRFEARGSRVHDADAWANKGVLLVEVDPGLGGPCLEVASTHLIWGTGLLGGAHAADPARRHALRMRQADELVSFLAGCHRPGNAMVLAGDFNVPAYDPAAPGGPDGWYRDLTDRLAELGLVDSWASKGIGAGPTCGDAADPFDEPDPAAPGMLLDDPDRIEPARRERIDYVFVRSPHDGDELLVETGRPRRRAFPRAADAPARSRLPRLSDHLALSVDLRLRRA